MNAHHYNGEAGGAPASDVQCQAIQKIHKHVFTISSIVL